MVMLCSAPVSLSWADTLRMPLASIVEGHLDLGLAPRRGPDALQPEAAQDPVVGGPLALALQHHDVHRGLVVLGGGEHLGCDGPGWWCCAR